MTNTIEIHFDGGCSPNPGNKYGSYEVLLEDYPICRKNLIQLGHGTNNEAEFESLIAALEDLRRWSVITGFDLSSVGLQILTDSMIVKNRLAGKNVVHKNPKYTESSQRMFSLASKVLEYKELFASFSVQWNPREKNVERFGH